MLGAARAGTLLIDMTTSEPSLAREIAAAAAARGVEALDAPVSGGDVGAREATLVIMVGGSPEAFERARPLFEVLGPHDRPRGRPGRRAAHQDGQPDRDRRRHDRRLRGAALRPPRGPRRRAHARDDLRRRRRLVVAGNLAPRTLRGDFAPGFKVDHFIKDLGIALAEARRMDLALPGLALAEQLYIAARAQGLGAARHARAAAGAREPLGRRVARRHGRASPAARPAADDAATSPASRRQRRPGDAPSSASMPGSAPAWRRAATV